jgi:(R,R)-butanediol dehydrogenase/meso-butanediol dehydrogenase/diacetyl reductase
MKAGVLYGKEDFRIEERAIPIPGPNQLVVKIDVVGVCGTDVDFYKSGFAPGPLPMVLGHENAGTVSAVGEGVTGFSVGDRLLLGPPAACAEGCPSCARGETNICTTALPRTAGIGGPDGGYAEYYLVQDVTHMILVKIPENVDEKDAVLFDVICVALHGIRKSKFKVGDDVVVSGTGPIGLSAIQFLKAGGANRLIVLGTSDEKEAMLRQYGADHFINAKKTEDLAGEIRKILGKAVGADIAFECAGNNVSLANLLHSAVKPGGQVMVLGSIQDPMTNIVPASFSVHEIGMDFSFVYTEDDVRVYLQMLATGKVAFPGMVTDIMSLGEAEEKALARKDRAGQIKILIDPSKS